MDTPKVGQTVYLKRLGNNARYRSSDELIVEGVVTSVRRKYFGVSIGYGDIDFCIDDWSEKPTDYISDWHAYESRQAIADDERRAEIVEFLSRYSKWRYRSLDQLERIKSIIEED
jgi:hypothetical protein